MSEFGEDIVVNGVPLLHEEIAAWRHGMERGDVGDRAVPHVRSHLRSIDVRQQRDAAQFSDAAAMNHVGLQNTSAFVFEQRAEFVA